MTQLSIIVPVYKTEKYLEQCVDSILAQTISDYEIILVDDGSPDGCGVICDRYAREHENVQVIHKQNQGLTAARQTGIAAAQGTYVAFVDSDDWVSPDMYEHLLTQAVQNKADLVSGGFIQEFDDHSVPCFDAIPAGVYQGQKLKEILPDALYCVDKMCQGLAPSTCTKLYRKETAIDHFLSRKDSASFGEDTLFTFPVLFKSGCLVVDTAHAGYHYRILGNSMSHGHNPKFFSDVHTVYTQISQAAEPVMTPALRTAVAYDYVFLFSYGLYQELSRANKDSYFKKYQILKTLMQDPYFLESLPYVDLDRLSADISGEMKLLAQKKPAAFMLHYLSHGIMRKLFKKHS